MKTVLVVAAHPDDEVLGCGGTIAKHAEQGDEVHVVIMAEGEMARPEFHQKDQSTQNFELKRLHQCCVDANQVLGTKMVHMLGMPDNQLDTLSRLEIVQKLEKIIDQIKPSVIYCHHPGDLNVDHRRVCEAVVTACRPIPGMQVTRILSFEVLSSTEWGVKGLNSGFEPNYFNNIEFQLEKKLRALDFYQSEMREWPHTRSLKTAEYLMRVRGAQVGYQAAEAFCILREIQH